MAAKDEEIETLNKKNAELAEAIKTMEEAKASTDEEKNTLETEKAEVEKKLAEAQEKLDTQEAENVAIARTSTLVDKGIDKEEAEKLVSQYASLNDEMFEGIVDLATKAIAEVEAEAETEVAEASDDTEEEEDNTDLEGEIACQGGACII